VTWMHGPWIGAATALAVATAVAGCGGRAVATPAPVPTPILSGTAQLRLPITSYELSDTQSAEAEYLGQLYAQECMHGFGFEYLPGLSISSIAQNSRITAELNSRRYGVSDPTAAATYGYHIPSWARSAAAPTPFPRPGDPEFRVLTGQPAGRYHGRPVPAGGCLGQASGRLTAADIDTGAQASGGPDQSALVQQIASQGFARAQADRRVRTVDARWTACMRSHGYAYATPFQAANHWNLNAPVSTTEIQTAEHDIACKRQVNLIGVEFAVESDYENADIARNAQVLANARTEIAADAAGLRRLMANVKDQAATG
jgi:hypothetical protein